MSGLSSVYLQSFLSPFEEILARPDVTDIYVNRPHEIWIESLTEGIERVESPALDEATLSRLARQIAAQAHQGISREHPLLSASLRDGTRVQIIGPPATRDGHVYAFRKNAVSRLTLSDYVQTGAFEPATGGASQRSEIDNRLAALLEQGDFGELLKLAVQSRRNILISGGTSSGKTTFLNMLIAEIADSERLVFIEDTPELHLPHANAIGLIGVRGALGESILSTDDLLTASLRMRPDRIILGELRGGEAHSFLRAVNSGHPGSMTTVHADSPDGAIEQIALLLLQSGTRLSRQDIHAYVRNTIDVFVQLDRRDGRRVVSEISLKSIQERQP